MNRKSVEWEISFYWESLSPSFSHKFDFFTLPDRSMPENTILSSGNQPTSSEIICKMCLRQNSIKNTAFKNRNRPIKRSHPPIFPGENWRKKYFSSGASFPRVQGNHWSLIIYVNGEKAAVPQSPPTQHIAVLYFSVTWIWKYRWST